MKRKKELRLLFLDHSEEWLEFASNAFDGTGFVVHTALNFDHITIDVAEPPYDITFVSLDRARTDLSLLSRLVQNKGWYVVVLIPGSVDVKLARLFFKAGINDVQSKPYDANLLYYLVEEQAAFAQKRRNVGEAPVSQREYLHRVRQLRDLYLESNHAGLGS